MTKFLQKNMPRKALINHAFKAAAFFSIYLFSSLGLSQGKTIGTLKVGIILPLSGKMAPYGQEIKDSFTLSTAQALKKAGKKASSIKLYFEDNRGSTEESKKIAENLLKKKRVSILVGGFSTPESSILSDLAQKYNKIYLSILTKDLSSLSKNKNTFLLTSSYRWQSEVAAQYVGEFDKSPSVAIVSLEDADAKSNLVVSSFSKVLRKVSRASISNILLAKEPEIIEPEPAKVQAENENTGQPAETTGTAEPQDSEANEQDQPPVQIDPNLRFVEAAQAIINSKANMVFIPYNWSTSSPIIAELQRKGYKGSILGLEYWESRIAYSTLINMKTIKAFHVTHYRSDNIPLEFVSSFQSQFKRSPSALAGLGFDAAQIISQTYFKAKSVRATPLRDAMRKTREFDGLLSYLRMGWDRSVERALSISAPRKGGAGMGVLMIPSDLTIRPPESTPKKK